MSMPNKATALRPKNEAPKNLAPGTLIVGLVLACYLTASFTGCNDWLTKDVVIGSNEDRASRNDNTDNESPEDDDGDGLSNSVEESFDLDTKDSDTDQDGVGDGLELVVQSGDPLDARTTPAATNKRRNISSDDATRNSIDSDRDGLGDNFEEDNELDADNADTDGDGYSDALELIAESDPFSDSDRPNRDNAPVDDGLDDSGTSPADSDGDGLSQEIETRNNTSSTQLDTDGDGFSDGVEVAVGSAPDDELSIPNFTVPEAPEQDELEDSTNTNSNTNSNSNDNSEV